MSDLQIVAICLVAVFVGLAVLSLIISLFPVLIPAKAAQPATKAPTSPAAAAAVPQEEEEEIAAIIAAVQQAFEEEQANPLVRNREGL